MRKITVIGLSIAFVALCAYSRAQAEPPPNGWYGAFPVPSVACDTKDEIKAIVEAANKGSDELTAMFAKYHDEKNATGEPVCVYGHLEAFAVGESEYLGLSKTMNGQQVKTWVLHAGNEHAEFYVLYSEKISSAPETSI